MRQQPSADVEATQQQVAVPQFRCPKCGASLIEMHYAEVTRAARARDIVCHCAGHHLNLEVKSMVGMKTQADFDPAKAEAFADRLLMALNNGALCLMVSVGHRTGLFDVLRTLPPATSHEIATRAGLHERYVREWLGAMVTAGVIEVDP